jgi:hypothetical protein
MFTTSISYLRRPTTGVTAQGKNTVCASPKRATSSLRRPTRPILSGPGNRRSIRRRRWIPLPFRARQRNEHAHGLSRSRMSPSIRRLASNDFTSRKASKSQSNAPPSRKCPCQRRTRPQARCLHAPAYADGDGNDNGCVDDSSAPVRRQIPGWTRVASIVATFSLPGWHQSAKNIRYINKLIAMCSQINKLSERLDTFPFYRIQGLTLRRV